MVLHACAPAYAPAHAQTTPPAYYEFGSVVAVGQRTVNIRTFDTQLQRMVQHSFVLSRDSRADVVRVGDQVEVIFTAGPTSAAEWTIRRLIQLNTSTPRPGPPVGDHRDVPSPVEARIAPAPPAAKVPTPIPTRAATVAAKPATASTRGVTLPPAATPSAPPASVDLGVAPPAKVPSVRDADLAGGEATMPKSPTLKEVVREVPLEECNRSSADWPTQPLRLAVLDFRYPTEREEAHDFGTTGGGSGTAVADLIYSRLDQLNEFAMMRGDRTRLYRSDFAGAARVGREIGADAVLAGTFKPMDPPPGSDPDFPPPKTYELSAGIVDTCTGQLLLRLISIQCPPGLDPNAPSNLPSCKSYAVTAKQATDPRDQAHAFRQPIDALLYPLEHDGPPPGTQGSAGLVTLVSNSAVTLKLPAGVALKPGDQVAIHAWRLTKNPTTYTLHNLHDEEIGRLTLSSVHNGNATGTFSGDFPPKPGDTAELIQQ
jgi:hypothetical protein